MFGSTEASVRFYTTLRLDAETTLKSGDPVDWCVACIREAIATKLEYIDPHECCQTAASLDTCSFCWHRNPEAWNNDAGTAECRFVPRHPELQHLARKVIIELWIVHSIDRGIVDDDDNQDTREDALNKAWRAFRVFWDALIEYDERPKRGRAG